MVSIQISLLANDLQFLCYVLKQCLSGLELIRADWGILYCYQCLTALMHYGAVA